MRRELGRFLQAEIVWCQEEPKNQGAWNFIEPNLEWVLTQIGARQTRPAYAGRTASASPATGNGAPAGSTSVTTYHAASSSAMARRAALP